jgi:hypothetical protein
MHSDRFTSLLASRSHLARLDDAREFEGGVRKEMIRFLRRQHLIAQWDPSKLDAEFQSELLAFLDQKLMHARERQQDLAEADSVLIRQSTLQHAAVNAAALTVEQIIVKNTATDLLRDKLRELEDHHRQQLQLEAQEQQQMI